MDVLSDAIAAMRTGRPHSSLTQQSAPWGVWFDQYSGAGFHVVLQGNCWLIPARGEPLAMGVGDVVLLPTGVPHGLADDPSRPLEHQDSPTNLPTGQDDSPIVLLCGAYQLDQDRLHPLLAELPDVIHIPARAGRHTALRAAVDLLGEELAQAGAGRDGALPSLLDLLLLYMLRAWYDENEFGWASALRDPVIAAALRDIHNDPGRAWTVEELGARAGLSRAPFARRFTALVGRPPLAYLTWWRMTLAARLLQGSDVPLRSVAERTGYSSEFAFAKAFKREYGTAPGQYRREVGVPAGVV